MLPHATGQALVIVLPGWQQRSHYRLPKSINRATNEISQGHNMYDSELKPRRFAFDFLFGSSFTRASDSGLVPLHS